MTDNEPEYGLGKAYTDAAGKRTEPFEIEEDMPPALKGMLDAANTRIGERAHAERLPAVGPGAPRECRNAPRCALLAGHGGACVLPPIDLTPRPGSIGSGSVGANPSKPAEELFEWVITYRYRSDTDTASERITAAYYQRADGWLEFKTGGKVVFAVAGEHVRSVQRRVVPRVSVVEQVAEILAGATLTVREANSITELAAARAVRVGP